MIYIDKDYKCHVSDDGTMTPIETDVFDGKPDAYIEGFRFIPKGESWTREDGVVLRGEMIAPWQDMRILEAYQNQYEVNLNEIEDLRDRITVVEETIGTLNTVTAHPGDVLIGKAYVSANGITIKGVMPNRGAVHEILSVDTDMYYIPEGYHNGSGTVSIVFEDLEITPDKERYILMPPPGTVYRKITIEPVPYEYVATGDATAVDTDIRAGKTAYVDGVEVIGRMPEYPAFEMSLTLDNKVYVIPEGYHSGNGTVRIVLEGLTVTPDKESHTISPSTGKVFGEVTINPIPNEYITTTDANAVANDILSGKTAYVKGTKVAGSMVNNGAINKTIDGLTTSTVTIPAGYTTGGTVSLTSDIEARLSAI